MTCSSDSPIKRKGMTLLRALGAFLILVVTTHVAWNLFAPELLGLPEMRIKGAIGLVLLLVVLSFALRARRPAS